MQVSSGAARYWYALPNASSLLHELKGDRVNGFGPDPATILMDLPGTDPIALPLQPRVASSPDSVTKADALQYRFECVGHRIGGFAVLESKPLTHAIGKIPHELEGMIAMTSALMRLRNATRGLIGPSVFMPIAERSGLITQLGQWVVQRALATQAEWRLKGHLNPPVAVNVSMTEVLSGNLVETIGRLLNEFQMPAECLSVEITESVIMKDPRIAMSVLSGLKQMGISTTLDAHARSLTQAIIRMAEALCMTTIAEGVETLGQLKWLTSHNCAVGQGYWFSPPCLGNSSTRRSSASRQS